jgi:hypothetical protein
MADQDDQIECYKDEEGNIYELNISDPHASTKNGNKMVLVGYPEGEVLNAREELLKRLPLGSERIDCPETQEL